ncbi:MAG: YchJ family metal-binding protein [Nautiliaceae bacterium]
MKFSKNSKCPCGSGKKYKECCYKWHKISKAPNALLLMKSRYSAYALGDADYIIKTTHSGSPHYEKDIKAWKKSIKNFSESEFKKLEIVEYKNEGKKAFVKFKAYIDDFIMEEESFFVKEDKWYYVEGVEKGV